MNTAIERFVRFHKHLQLEEGFPGRNALEEMIGVSGGYITKALSKKSAMGSDLLERIIKLFPQLNIVWLLTGEGDMILTEENDMAVTKDSRDNIILILQGQLKEAYAEIGRLNMELKAAEEHKSIQKIG